MAENIAVAFNQEARQNQIENVIKEHANMKKIVDFLEGKSRHQHLFFFYQKPDVINDKGEYVDGPGDPKLLVTTGEHERIKSRAVYFLRNVPPERAVKADVSVDGELLFGEVAGCPLESLNTALMDVFFPLICQPTAATDWGHCDEEQKGDFKTGFEKFTIELSQGIQSLTGSIELKKLNKDFGIDSTSTSYHDIVKDQPEAVQAFESLVEEWCRQIEQYLDETLDHQREVADPGPRTELDFWSARMQKITSIAEQLKSKECKTAFGVLHAVTRVSADAASKSRQTVFNTMRRWKQIDISITEAYNESKDTV